ncbi:MAG: family transcriptional regulator, cyclic receptor protein [Chloroflexota bacterium]|jgi:CRP-like cAMP-binding protein|nr:family transcriptional regulator, cyclic receptor protein [Chloroflexota bacterium]
MMVERARAAQPRAHLVPLTVVPRSDEPCVAASQADTEHVAQLAAVRRVLAEAALFAELPPSPALAALLGGGQLVGHQRGQVLAACGEPSATLHLILTGAVKVLAPAPAGAPIILALRGPGQLVGELGMHGPSTNTTTAVALLSTRSLAIPQPAFQFALRASPVLLAGVVDLLTARLHEANARSARLLALDLGGRLAWWLDEVAAQFGRPTFGGAIAMQVPTTQRDLAAMVGGSRESMSKLLGGFERGGMIRRHGHQLELLDQERLRQRAS